METPQIALLVVVGFFGAYLLLQVRPMFSRKRRVLLAAMRAARRKASEAGSDSERAQALVDGAEAAASARRWTAAAGLLSRALRLQPASVTLVDRAAVALEHNPRLSRLLFERRLAILTRADAHGPAYVSTARVLARLYRRSPRSRGLAAVLDRLVEHEEGATAARPAPAAEGGPAAGPTDRDR